MADIILYSFRRCPYAMRARLAIAYAQIQLQLRAVVLKHKPQPLRTDFTTSLAKTTLPATFPAADKIINIVDS